MLESPIYWVKFALFIFASGFIAWGRVFLLGEGCFVAARLR
nr:MAG: hypothetical protein BECKFM1743C_GA0114222_100619 [Candidatus Kentron sp. FM]